MFIQPLKITICVMYQYSGAFGLCKYSRFIISCSFLGRNQQQSWNTEDGSSI